MTLRSNAFYCKDARGSEEISNLAQHSHRWPLADKRVVTRKKSCAARAFWLARTPAAAKRSPISPLHTFDERPRQLAVVWKGLFFLQEFAEKSSEHTART